MASTRYLFLTLAASGMLAGAGLVGCNSVDRSASDSRPALFDNLGAHTWRATTSSADAQRYFNQGVIWMYSFNHDEAIRNFRHAAQIDPNFAMAWWGVSLCNGPHVNNPAMDAAHSRAAWDALQKACELAPHASPLEQSLIAALGARYADPGAGTLPLTAAERAPLDAAYADAMASVYASHPDNTEVATLYAEAIMDTMPWDYWSKQGEPRPRTRELLRVLESVLAADPSHPGANHLYIHAVEASPHPELADAAASRLRTLVPASGHMVHMPAHIDVRMGRWNLSASQNQKAIRVHDQYVKRSPTQGFYRLYMLHNDHFLSYACMMAGRKQDALAAARATVDGIPDSFYKDFSPLADTVTPIEVESLMRFGQWDAILAFPEPRESLPITRALWRFARGVALAAKGDVAAARAEQDLFEQSVSNVPAGAMMAANPASNVLELAREMLEGEILYREKDFDGAVKRLSRAVEIEDTLNYMEPPDWVQPVRHALGAVLLEAGQPEQAARVYQEDLQRWPENGWSLFGMSEAMTALGKSAEAAEYHQRYKKAFSQADIDLRASCLCADHLHAAK
ncbi:MAG: hypothetical protein AB7G11_02055 [Phycisphaerales bacterium]